MKKLKIIWTFDSCECDDCGWSYADGFKAYLDGELLDEFVPHAACFDGDTINESEALVRILAKLDIELEYESE